MWGNNGHELFHTKRSTAHSGPQAHRPDYYDARDPETKFPPITPLRPPTGSPNLLFILPQVSVKGEVGKNEGSTSRHTGDGKMQKTPIGPPPEQRAQPRGLRGKIVDKKKVDEMTSHRHGDTDHLGMALYGATLSSEQFQHGLCLKEQTYEDFFPSPP